MLDSESSPPPQYPPFFSLGGRRATLPLPRTYGALLVVQHPGGFAMMFGVFGDVRLLAASSRIARLHEGTTIGGELYSKACSMIVGQSGNVKKA